MDNKGKNIEQHNIGDFLDFCKPKDVRYVLAATIIYVALGVILSYVPFFFVLWCCLGGFVVIFHNIGQETLLPNLLFSYSRKRKVRRKSDDELSLLKRHCPVCGNDGCERHSDISMDESFVDELRSSLRFVAAVLLRRIYKVDIAALVLDKVMKSSISHLHFYLNARKKAHHGRDISQVVLDHYCSNLHGAVRNRRAELDYLRALSERIFPHVLPPKALKCRSLCVLLREVLSAGILMPALDVLANPDIVNNIIILLLDRSLPAENQDPKSELVPILASFSHPLAKKQSTMHMQLSDVLEKPELLFPFMQFMKQEASVSVLQFYLSVEEFNNKILNPDLSKKEIQALHDELVVLYNAYFEPSSGEKIQFDDDISVKIKSTRTFKHGYKVELPSESLSLLSSIVEGPPESVVRLQTSTPLFRAYEHVYNLLEHTFLPLFHQSDDYYRMTCGERLHIPSSRSRSSSSLTSLTSISSFKSTTSNRSSSAKREASSLAKIGHKIKGVFKNSQADAVSQRSEDELEASEESVPLTLDSNEDSSAPLRLHDNGPLRDLSAWRISINEVANRPDPENPKRSVLVFVVEVRRVDVQIDDFETACWSVDRRYNEFHALEQKLQEFHGDVINASLPPKKNFGTRGREFLEQRVAPYEAYLRQLLTMPRLKGSELLYRFLTSEDELAASFLPDLNLGKMVKSGAMKLVKERGQHLDPFLQSFQLSCEQSKPRPNKSANSESDTLSISSEKMSNSMYENLADQDLTSLARTPSHACHHRAREMNVSGVFDTLLYLAHHIYQAPSYVRHVLLVSRMLFHNTINSFCDWYLAEKIHEKLSDEHRVEKIIHLLRDILFFDNDPPRTEDDKTTRREEAKSYLHDVLPKVFVTAIGEDRHIQGTELLLEALQHPKINKQLSYVLLDHVIEELFPELYDAERQVEVFNPFQSAYRRPED